jgi:radical SAM protein with 4Fe4S-binding SPASM domain
MSLVIRLFCKYYWYLVLRLKIFSMGEKSTFCILPWTHLHILPDAKVLPCCVSPYAEPFGDVSKTTTRVIWNNDFFKRLRLNMLGGKKSETCRRCYELESCKATSLRLQANEMLKDSFDVVKSTYQDGSVPKFEMHYLDIRFSNICNLKCLGCSPMLSSKWYEDYEKLYDKKIDHSKILNANELSINLWEELEEQLPYVKRAYFAGGEPLLMDEHYRCLNYFIEHKKTDVAISYNTNLSSLKNKNFDVLSYWKQFREIYLSISIDDIEGPGEYFRFGLKWDKLVANILKVKRECPQVSIEITCTINLFNISRLPEIHGCLRELDIIQEHNFYMNFLLDPHELTVNQLPEVIKVHTEKKLMDYLESLTNLVPEKDWQKLIHDFKLQIDFMKKKSDQGLQQKFLYRTRKLDKIRGNSFEKAYPELAEAFAHEEKSYL